MKIWQQRFLFPLLEPSSVASFIAKLIIVECISIVHENMATALPLSPLSLPEMESRGCSVASFMAVSFVWKEVSHVMADRDAVMNPASAASLSPRIRIQFLIVLKRREWAPFLSLTRSNVTK